MLGKTTMWGTNISGARQRAIGLLLVVLLLAAACNRTAPTPGTAVPTVATPNHTVTATGTQSDTVAQSGTGAEAIPAAPPATSTFVAGAPTPDARGTATGAAAGSVTEGAIFTSPRFSYTVVLPCCWLALPTPGTAIESAMSDLAGDDAIPLWGDLDEKLRERASGAVLELVALLPDEENVAVPIAQATVSVLPTYGLTLEEYADATAGELARIANTSVQSARIDPRLGVGGFPAAVIEYTAAPTSATPDATDQSIAGLQVAFFGEDADALIVLTFTTSMARFGELLPEFMHIVRTVTLHDTTM